jgi:hypothetical protein
MYVWQREFLTAIGRNALSDAARQYSDHTYDDQWDITLEDYYDYGPGNQDVTAPHHGENLESSGVLWNRMRELFDSSNIRRRSSIHLQKKTNMLATIWHLTTRIKPSKMPFRSSPIVFPEISIDMPLRKR